MPIKCRWYRINGISWLTWSH